MGGAWDLTISPGCGYPETVDTNDLERSVVAKGNPGDRRKSKWCVCSSDWYVTVAGSG